MNCISLFSVLSSSMILLFVIFFVLSSSSTTSAEEKNVVIELDDNTIEAAISKSPQIFIMFYAGWCNHCKKLMPEFKSAAVTDQGVMTYAAIDAASNPEAQRKFNIKAFPTLKMFRNGKFSGDYEGGRTASDLSSYTNTMRTAAVFVIPNAKTFIRYRDEFAHDNAICMDTVDSETCKNFDAVADTIRGTYIKFLALADTKIATEVGLESSLKKILLFRPNQEPRMVEIKQEIVDGGNVEALRHEIHTMALPAFGEINPASYRKYMAIKLPMLYLFLNDVSLKNADDRAAFNAVRQAANEFKGKLTFAYIDASKYSSMAPRVGLTGEKFPAVSIDNAGSFYTFPSKDSKDITMSEIVQFARQYLSGSLKRVIRSDPTPVTHTMDGLTTIVGNTFEKLVDKSEHDHVFILFHAPFCSFCKTLAAPFAEVAKKLKDEEVTVAKFDATTNDYDKSRFAVHGFPTIYYIKKGLNGATETPEEYTGERSTEAMLNFLREKLD